MSTTLEFTAAPRARRERTHRSVDGRVLGSRGRATRRAVLDALLEEIQSVPWQSVTISSVMRRVGMSPATFFRYFHTVLEALIELCKQLESEQVELPPRLERVTHLCAGETRGRRKRLLPDPIAARESALRQRVAELEEQLASASASAPATRRSKRLAQAA